MNKLILLLLIFPTAIMARPDIKHTATCFGVKQNKISFQRPCVVTEGGGAGTLVLEYNIKSEIYTIIESDDENTLNGKSYTTYIRDKSFVKSKDNNHKKYFCYQTTDKKIEFCSAQS